MSESYFTQRPMNDCKMERSNECCFGLQQLLPNSTENFISHEKKRWLVAAQYLQALKSFWLSNWVSIAKVVACFPQASLLRLIATSSLLGNTLCLISPVQSTQTVQPTGCKVGSGPRYQILSHVFARCSSQKNLLPCENCDFRATANSAKNSVWFSHGCRFFDSRNVQKSVTQIIYLGALPIEKVLSAPK